MGFLRLILRGLFDRDQRPEHQRDVLERVNPIREAAPIVVPDDRFAPRRQQVPRPVVEPRVIRGRCWVIDGDTIVIDKVHIRLAGIDAPELDHPYGQKAKWTLHALCKGQVITAITDGEVSHERAVAICRLPDGRDLAAEMVKAGMAIDWPKYSGGRYGHLEPPGLRKRLWRADARQWGQMLPTRRES